MTTPQPGDRRPREGRCERCDRPLTDEVWETWEPISWTGQKFAPVTDWNLASDQPDRCHGTHECSGERVDWKARCVELQVALREARSTTLFEAWCEVNRFAENLTRDNEPGRGFMWSARDAIAALLPKETT